MTAPFTDWTGQFGSTSPMYQGQLDAFNAMREAFMQQQMQQHAAMNYSMNGSGLPTTPYAITHQAPIASPEWRDEDLVAAGMFWGIPEQAARAMPRETLLQYVNEQRASGVMPSGGVNPLAAQFGLGVMQGITGGLRNLPLGIGKALSKIDLLRNADMQLRMMEESVRSTMPQDQQWIGTGANIAGNLAALWYPGNAAWAIAGKAGAIIPFIKGSRVAMGAFQGGASAWALEGGSEMADQHPYLFYGGAAGLGAAGAEIAGRLAARVTKSFVPEPQNWEIPFNGSNPRSLPGDIQPGAARFGDALTAPGGEAGPIMPRRMGPIGPDTREGMILTGPWEDAVQREVPPVMDSQLTIIPTIGNEVNQQFEAMLGGRSIGELVVALGEKPYARNIFVEEPYRRQGVATRLYDFAEQVLGKKMRPSPYSQSNEAQAFWQDRLDRQQADILSVQLNKVGTVVQSPEFANIAGQTSIDDLAVARAAQATNPGGVNIVQGVTDPAQFVKNLGDVRFVQRGNRLDAILVHEGKDANKIVSQYEKYGMFEGQLVYTADGLEGRIIGLADDGVAVQPRFSGATQVRPISEIHPWLTSGDVTEVPQLWEGFREYVERRALMEAAQMGPRMSQEQMLAIKTQNMVQYADDFLDDLRIGNPADRERILEYFNARFVDSFKELAPMETALQQIATANYNSTVQANPLSPLQALDQAAATKGFLAIPEGSDIVLRKAGQVEMRFDSIEAANEFVRQTNVQLPDITPPSDVPFELMAQFHRAPTQGPNLNGRLADDIVRSADELQLQNISDAGISGVAPPPPMAPTAGGTDNIGRLKNQWTDGFLRWRPARRFFSQIDQALFQSGIETGIAADYDRMSQLVVQHHTDMHPFMDELTDITRKIKTDKLVNGEWFRLLTAPNRTEKAVLAGFKPEEIAAFDEFESLLSRVSQHVQGLPEAPNSRDVIEYFRHIAARQSDPETAKAAFEYFHLSPNTQPFYEYAKTGNLNFRELDPRSVGESYIRSLFWKKNMEEPFTAMASKWKGLSETEELKPAATIMREWMNIIRYGYHAEDDTALDMLHGALRLVVGPEISRKQAAELFNFGLNTTHSGMLGFRPHVMARDALQLFLAVPRAGADLTNVMRQFMTSEEARSRIFAEAVAEGAVSLQSPRMASPGALVGEMEALSASAGGAGPLNRSDYGWRMKAAADVSAAVRDLMPSWLRDTRDSPLHAMYLYGKQSEIMRALVYTAGKDKAARALANFRAAGPAGSLEELMGASSARTFDPSWQREFLKFVSAGDDQGAARFLGRQLADATQFKYGVVESPWAAKSITGRVAMQMGNYFTQYLQYLRESLVNGNLTDKAKFALTAGAVTAGLEAASRETGWNFRTMNPFFGLGFTGGIWINIASDVAQGAGTALRELQGGQPREAAYVMAGQALNTAATALNPASGLIRQAQAVGQSLESPYPASALLRSQVTGEIGPGPDVNQWLMPQTEAMFQRSLSPQPSPVNATQFGLPPGMFPPQVQSGPPELGLPPSTLPQGNFSPQTPAPGGGAAGFRPTPNSISPEVLNRAVAGDTTALSQFDQQDQQFIRQLGPVPPDVRMQVWSSWLIQKANQNVRSQQSTVPGLMQPPPSMPYGASPPGAGSMQ